MYYLGLFYAIFYIYIYCSNLTWHRICSLQWIILRLKPPFLHFWRISHCHPLPCLITGWYFQFHWSLDVNLPALKQLIPCW